jgi:predicted nucleic acid-binding protein
MERTKSTIRVVCDADPIIHLDELGCLDLLDDFQEISLSDTVWKEISRYRPSAARLVAKQMGFNVHGTIGILVRSIRRGQMKPKEVLRILTEIPQKTTLYIKHSLLEEISLKIRNEFNL